MKSVKNRFWNKVNIRGPDDCWIWQGCISGSGYGSFNTGNNKKINSSRFAWILVNGPIVSKSLLVLHRCDNKSCCNPNHLYLGTHGDNVNDLCKRNPLSLSLNGMPSRFYEGESWLMKKLRKAGFSYSYISKIFKCSPAHIANICKGKITNLKKEEVICP